MRESTLQEKTERAELDRLATKEVDRLSDAEVTQRFGQLKGFIDLAPGQTKVCVSDMRIVLACVISSNTWHERHGRP